MRRADIKTGTSCNSNCVFCVIGDVLFTGDRSTEDVLAELRGSRRTCEGVVFTGAEVTLRDDFFVLLAAARRLGYASIQVQTNGRRFAYRKFAALSVEAGANEFAPAIHGHTAKLHDGLTRSAGSFEQIVAGIRNLRALGQRVITNTVATRQNARWLPDLARLLVTLDVQQFQIAFPHPTGHAATYFDGVVPRVSEVAPHIAAALDVGNAAGVPCYAEAMPYCTLPGKERQVAELIIPPTEIVYDGYVVPDYAADRMARGKTRFPQCSNCRFEPMCEGPWREYPERLGSDEFQPVAGPRVLDGDIVLDDRFARLGARAPLAGDLLAAVHATHARWIAVAFYPEDGSPACTAEACALREGDAALQQAGVAAIGVSPDPPARHAAFAATHNLRFPLISDEDGAIARAFGAVDARGMLRRSTYLIGPGRTIDHVIVRPEVRGHAAQIVDAIRRYEAPPRPLAKGDELLTIRRVAR